MVSPPATPRPGSTLAHRAEVGVIAAAAGALPALTDAGVLPPTVSTILGLVITGLCAVWHITPPVVQVVIGRRGTAPAHPLDVDTPPG